MSDKPRLDPVDAACLMNERAQEALAAANLPRAERLARRAVAVHAFRRDELRVAQLKLDEPEVLRYKLTVKGGEG